MQDSCALRIDKPQRMQLTKQAGNAFDMRRRSRIFESERDREDLATVFRSRSPVLKEGQKAPK
jgi:hypothetical protein